MSDTKSIVLSWNGLTASIKGQTILDNCQGYCSPGSMLAIMGPSGAGKTTLLSILAKKASSDLNLSGKVSLNLFRSWPTAKNSASPSSTTSARMSIRTTSFTRLCLSEVSLSLFRSPLVRRYTQDLGPLESPDKSLRAHHWIWARKVRELLDWRYWAEGSFRRRKEAGLHRFGDDLLTFAAYPWRANFWTRQQQGDTGAQRPQEDCQEQPHSHLHNPPAELPHLLEARQTAAPQQRENRLPGISPGSRSLHAVSGHHDPNKQQHQRLLHGRNIQPEKPIRGFFAPKSRKLRSETLWRHLEANLVEHKG